MLKIETQAPVSAAAHRPLSGAAQRSARAGPRLHRESGGGGLTPAPPGLE